MLKFKWRTHTKQIQGLLDLRLQPLCGVSTTDLPVGRCGFREKRDHGYVVLDTDLKRTDWNSAAPVRSQSLALRMYLLRFTRIYYETQIIRKRRS